MLTLFSWAIPPTPGNASAVPALLTSPVPAKTNPRDDTKTLIPTQHTHRGRVFCMSYIPEDKEPCAPEMQWGPSGAAVAGESAQV